MQILPLIAIALFVVGTVGVDGLPLVAATAAMLAVVVSAAIIGARRATDVDPMVALRVE